MAGTWLFLPPDVPPYGIGVAATFAALPTTVPAGSVYVALDTFNAYVFNGVTWQLVGAGVSGVTDTDSIDMTTSLGIVSSTLRLSANAADAGNLIVSNNIESVGTPGLRSQISQASIRGLLSATTPLFYDSSTGIFTIQQASTIASGYLSSVDFNTFNNKEPAIAAGTVNDYWRGDKSFQVLNTAALLAVTDGSSATAGDIGEILTGSQATNTTSGVAATSTWGAVTSVSLTAGVWAVSATVGFNENGATLTTALEAGVSDSATGVGIDEFNTTVSPYLISSTSDAIHTTPEVIVNISGTTTYYANTRFYYTAGTPRHRGRIRARRIR